MNQIEKIAFQNRNQILDDEDCNIWEDDLCEGKGKNSLVRQSSLQQNMESNSFSKFDKTYRLRNTKKFKSYEDVEERKSIGQITYSNKDTRSKSNPREYQRISLKNEVNLLLKALIISKKNRKWSDPVSLFSLNNQCFFEDKNDQEVEEFVTMRQIEPAFVDNKI